jgi:hypothetical protein
MRLSGRFCPSAATRIQNSGGGGGESSRPLLKRDSAGAPRDALIATAGAGALARDSELSRGRRLGPERCRVPVGRGRLPVAGPCLPREGRPEDLVGALARDEADFPRQASHPQAPLESESSPCIEAWIEAWSRSRDAPRLEIPGPRRLRFTPRPPSLYSTPAHHCGRLRLALFQCCGRLSTEGPWLSSCDATPTPPHRFDLVGVYWHRGWLQLRDDSARCSGKVKPRKPGARQ